MNLIDQFSERYNVPRDEIAWWCDNLIAARQSGDRARILGDTERFRSIHLREGDAGIEGLLAVRASEVQS